MKKIVLEVKNLVTKFNTDKGQVTAVDNISFQVCEGETLAIVGESGSGKSVTSMSILGLIPSPPGKIENGEIVFEGKDLLKFTPDQMREIRGNKIAMIFQDSMASLNPSITIGKQVAEPINIHQGLSWNEAYQKAEEMLKRVQIPDAKNRLHAYPHVFSGGMRQRTMIAMALACNPKLIIADEPTTALDVTVQAQILDLIKDQTQKNNTSVILITHDLGVVARYADRVAVMYGGRIVEQGTAIDIFKRPVHPYTKGLLASIPRVDSDPNKPLPAIEGMPPDLSALPAGCAFAPRCNQYTSNCSNAKPDIKEISEMHSAACFNV